MGPYTRAGELVDIHGLFFPPGIKEGESRGSMLILNEGGRRDQKTMDENSSKSCRIGILHVHGVLSPGVLKKRSTYIDAFAI